MKALVKKNPSEGLWLEEVPVPAFRDDEVLIKTIKTSICGTDLHIYNWDDWAQKTIIPPTIIGHEFMGVIAGVGKNVRDLHKGQRVSGEGHITCGKCSGCTEGKRHLCKHTRGLGVTRPGCFAEYFNLPADNVFLLPATISDEVGAILDPFGNAVHTAFSAPLTAQNVLITGAGPIGIMAASVAQNAGARRVVMTDINDYRLELALKLGATQAINISKETLKEGMKTTGIEDFDVGMEMSGKCKALNEMLSAAKPGAHVALLGILPQECAIDWNLVIFKMLTLQGIYGREIFHTWHQMQRLLEGGLDLHPLITHRYAAEDYQAAFAKAISGNCGKIILNWSNL